MSEGDPRGAVSAEVGICTRPHLHLRGTWRGPIETTGLAPKFVSSHTPCPSLRPAQPPGVPATHPPTQPWVTPVDADGIGSRGKEASRGGGEGTPGALPSLRALSGKPACPVGKGGDSLKSYLLVLGLSGLNNWMVIGGQ